MDYQKVPLTQSIGVELLKKIFGVYCIAAIFITLFQGWLEYSQTRNRVVQYMIEHQPLVEDGLANALWHLDQPLMDSLIKGILSQSTIIGVSVYNDKGEILAQGGNTKIASSTRPMLTKSAEEIDSDRYRHQFSLFDPNKLTTGAIGQAVFYTGNDVVIEEVKPTLISLLTAAVVKTLILWSVFIYFGQILLSRPLNQLMALVRKLPMDSDDSTDPPKKHKLNELQLFEFALTDITQKLRHTLRSLRSSNDQLSKINLHLLRAIEQSPTLSTILSAQGKVLYATPSLAELTGFNPQEIQTLFDQNFVKALPFQSLVTRSINKNSKQQKWSGEVKIRNKAGQNIYLHASLSPVYSEQGQIEDYLFSANNITELKQLELELKEKNIQQQQNIVRLQDTKNQLLQSEKMASIGQLAAGVAHEINNPVGFINANVDTLNNYLVDLFSLIEQYERQSADPALGYQGSAKLSKDIDLDFLRHDIPEMLKETQEGLQRVKKIVADLMLFSRTNETEFESYDLRLVLESTLNVAWHELKYKAEIIKELDDIPFIDCIPSQLNQVFMNLLINACQALPERGTITLRSKNDGDFVIIEIEDSGCGIEPENISRLFDPFFTTKEIGSGTGLGLSVSYSIIKKHQGEISVESQLGSGSCFSIRLPIRQPEVKQLPVDIANSAT
ncbi:MAG: ATP-binding protein [Pseudomonadales bacterium]|nr:ATP-binding protein [Pseudomonadales bacterium]NRA15151.1 PAS domain S-box protein [Oceanospirillaceae bacterium]